MDPCRGPPLWNQTHQERLCLYQLFAYNICIYLHMHLRRVYHLELNWRWFFPCPLGPWFRIEYSFGNPLEICLGSLLSKSKCIYCHWKEWIFPPKTWPFPSLDRPFQMHLIIAEINSGSSVAGFFTWEKTCAYAAYCNLIWSICLCHFGSIEHNKGPDLFIIHSTKSPLRGELQAALRGGL